MNIEILRFYPGKESLEMVKMSEKVYNSQKSPVIIGMNFAR